MKKMLGVLPVLALLAYVPRANAALVINYSINGGATTLCGSGADTGPVSCSFSGSGVTVTAVTATSNSPGTALGANQLADTVQVTSTGNATVQIWVTAQDFTSPSGAGLNYISNLSTTAPGQNTTSTAALQSCVSTTNSVAPALSCGGGSLTNTPETLTGGGSASGTVNSVVGPLGTPYSLQQAITLTLTAGSNFNIVTSQSLSPVPEPTSIFLLGSALLGVSMVIRKKQQQNRS